MASRADGGEGNTSTPSSTTCSRASRWRTRPGRRRPYARALDAFAAYAGLQDPKIETVTDSVRGQGDRRLPAPAAERAIRPPVVITIGGLDGRKENAVISQRTRTSHTASATFPSTCRAPASPPSTRSVPGAEREFYPRRSTALATRHDIDGQARRRLRRHLGRPLVRAARLRGAVPASAAPSSRADRSTSYFQPEWQRKALGTPRVPVRAVRGALGGLRRRRRWTSSWRTGPNSTSLKDRGLARQAVGADAGHQRACDDTQVPVDDLCLLLNAVRLARRRPGSIRDAAATWAGMRRCRIRGYLRW